jgi:ribA/ribD-fused uncharacterized protein
MKYDVAWLKRLCDGGIQPSFLFFSTRYDATTQANAHMVLSQWYPSPFQVMGQEYAHAAHWMMIQKAKFFGDRRALSDLLSGTDNLEIANRGRNIEGFEAEMWDKVKYDIVLQGNLHKFSQHKSLRAYISDTHPLVLTEANPNDPVWGIGMRENAPGANDPHCWNGLNLLGFALMEVRDILEDSHRRSIVSSIAAIRYRGQRGFSR